MTDNNEFIDELGQGSDISEYLGAIKRRRGRALVVASGLLAIAMGIAFGLPPVYESEGTILIEQQEIPHTMVQSTITTFADQRMQIINQRVMTTKNLVNIIEKYNLYEEERKHAPIQSFLTQMREEHIKLEPLKASIVDSATKKSVAITIAFSISFKSESPKLAQQVANELVSLFLEENLRLRATMTEQTTIFLSDELDKLQIEIQSLEKDLAEFKGQHTHTLPELASLNLRLVERAESDIQNLENRISVLEERKVYLESELVHMDPFGNTTAGATSPGARLKLLETNYISLLAIYGVEHPDIKRTKKEIDALRLEVGIRASSEELREQFDEVKTELAIKRETYSDDHPDVKRLQRSLDGLEAEIQKRDSMPEDEAEPELRPDNPAYIQVTTQLANLKIERSDTEAKRGQLESKLEELEARVRTAPQIEQEYRNLTRDYTNASNKYRELKAKLLSAKLSESLEAERKGERFTLIDPPSLPQTPVSPNRLAIAFLGIVFSIAGGIGTVAVSEALDTSVRNAKGVLRIVGSAPLAVIPYIEIARDHQRKFRRRLGIIIAILLSGVAGVVIIHFFFVPLDVAWFRLLRKMHIEY